MAFKLLYHLNLIKISILTHRELMNMEQQLQDLINKIKTEGIEKADNESVKIIQNAKRDAEEIIKNAKSEAEAIVSNAKSDALRIKESAEHSLSQAGRDLLIGIRSQITELLNQVVHAEINKSLTNSTLVSMLEKIAQNWNYDKHPNIEILLNNKDLETLKNSFMKKLQNKFRNGRILLKPSDTVDKGFFIGEKGKNTFYDFTDRGLAEVLSQYLNPYLSEILNRSVSGA